MSVQELIDRLNKVKDKNNLVYFPSDINYYNYEDGHDGFGS